MLAVAALSARQGVEAAREAGVPAVALDVFGDRDTCRAAQSWHAVGDAAALRFDEAALLSALDALAQRGDALGWIAGSGFEAQPGLLQQCAQRLRLLGTAPRSVQRLRDARGLFALLKSAGIAHPPVQFEPPSETRGWLEKDSASCGGEGVRHAARTRVPVGVYWQREQRGVPMSATYVADGRAAVVLGFNQQFTQARGDRPHVFGGVIGPLPVRPGVQRTVEAALRVLAGEHRLLGLGSLDFLLDGEEVHVLEVNARWPASAALYAHAQPMRLHLRACLDGTLPDAVPDAPAVHGWRIVFTRRPVAIDAALSDRLAAQADLHDLPRAGTHVSEGAPLCSVSAQGADAGTVRAELARCHDLLLDSMETTR